MSRRVKVKVCGMTRLDDIECAVKLDADAIGINLYAPSPRSVSIAQASSLIPSIPKGKRVLVDVETPPHVLEEYLGLGFDKFQIHFDVAKGCCRLAEWLVIVGRERLWLAPRIPPGEHFPAEVLDCCSTIVTDTYSEELFGGTGKTRDWDHFASLQTRHPQHRWILAGGLNSGNVSEAIIQSKTRFIDVNSGVESSPGKKDARKMEEFFHTLSDK